MNKKLNKSIKVGLSICACAPILINASGNYQNVNARTRVNSISSVTSLNQNRYKLSRAEKVTGGIALGVGAVGLIGTAVGIGLTESQYNQTKKTYEDIINRTYNSYYDEREKYMSDLFKEWNVPLPEKYKNPMKNDTSSEPTPGFDFGR